MKERRDSMESAHSDSSSQEATGQTRTASTTEPVNAPPFDAREHAVLLEFLDNFHPSEIDDDDDDPLPYTQDGEFLLGVSDVGTSRG